MCIRIVKLRPQRTDGREVVVVHYSTEAMARKLVGIYELVARKTLPARERSSTTSLADSPVQLITANGSACAVSWGFGDLSPRHSPTRPLAYLLTCLLAYLLTCLIYVLVVIC